MRKADCLGRARARGARRASRRMRPAFSTTSTRRSARRPEVDPLFGDRLRLRFPPEPAAGRAVSEVLRESTRARSTSTRAFRARRRRGRSSKTRRAAGGGQPLYTDAVGAAVSGENSAWGGGSVVLTPQGFVRAALAGKPTLSQARVGGKPMTVVSFTVKDKYKVNGYVNAQHLIEKIETWTPQPTLGDMSIETTFSDYRDFNGVKFPARIVQKQWIYPVLELNVTERAAERGGQPAGAGRRRAAGRARRVDEGCRRRLVSGGHARSEQPARRVQGLPCRRRVVRDRRARAGQHRRGAPARPGQADQVPRQFASPLRSLGGSAGVCRRGLDDHHARDEQEVLR